MYLTIGKKRIYVERDKSVRAAKRAADSDTRRNQGVVFLGDHPYYYVVDFMHATAMKRAGYEEY